jgi:hypothetical protein
MGDRKWRISTVNGGSRSIIAKAAISLSTLFESWTGHELYVLSIKASDGGSNCSDAKIEAIAWKQNKGGIRISKDQAKEVMIFARGLLECDFDALPQYDVSDLWNHPGALIGAKHLQVHTV